jgi:hypothetical protein
MKPIVSTICLLFAVAASLAAHAEFKVATEQDDDTLKFYLSKSDCVVLATITDVTCVTTDPEKPNYLCTIRVAEVCKGDPQMAGVTTNVNIRRFEETPQDRHPSLRKGGRCILFLKNAANTNTVPRLSSADMWFGVQCPSAAMGRSIERILFTRQQPAARGVSWAAMSGDLDLLKELEATGATLDTPDPRAFNWTPLIAAIYHGRTNVVQYLLTRKISLNSQDREGRTALMWAITASDTNTVWLLLEKGADPAIRDRAGVTALGYAETSPHRAVLSKWLNEHRPAGRRSD